MAPSAQRSSSPVLPSQITIEPSGMTTGPSGKPKSEASSVPSTWRPFAELKRRSEMQVRAIGFRRARVR